MEKFERVLRHLEIPRMVLVVPEGVYPFEIRRETIEIGYAWYLYRGDQAEFREHLLRSESYLLRLLDQVAEDHPIDPRRSVLLGFSQGGYLAGFMALRHPERFGGLVLASSRLKHEFLEKELQSGDLPHTLFLHSEEDPALPWPRVKEGAALLENAGGDVETYLHNQGHRLPPDALEFMTGWLRRKGFHDPKEDASD